MVRLQLCHIEFREVIMRILLLVLCLASVACSTKPIVTSNDASAAGYPQLVVVEDVPFDGFYVISANVFSNYEAIYFEPLNVDNVVIDESRLNARDKPWKLTDSDKVRLREYFDERVRQVFGESEIFTLQTESAGQQLRVAVELLEFTPAAAKDDFKSRDPGVKIYTRSVGDLIMRATITDAGTGDLLAVVEDKRRVGDSSRLERNDRVRNTRQVKRTFSTWLSRLQTMMMQLRAVPTE